MAWGKTEEQKQADREAKASKQWWESPVGQAHQARERGDKFFQIQIEVGRTSFFADRIRPDGDTDLLGQIEERGWKLEDVGYVFAGTVTTSSQNFSSNHGAIIGIYLFRAAGWAE